MCVCVCVCYRFVIHSVLNPMLANAFLCVVNFLFFLIDACMFNSFCLLGNNLAPVLPFRSLGMSQKQIQ